ncbi:aminoglycoside 3'-phosphotransferase [Deinococcus xinjiangensis]|uniref:Aminoglycoside 3'-phosphotransferase n=1 Tax=Deinococcus xinjiangensis TaxID=457454 RepID=A0ABP9V876_9DEIO
MTMPPLPETLRRVLPAARWEEVTLGQSEAGVWRSTKYIVKAQPLGRPTVTTLQQERERLRWLSGRIPAPKLVGYDRTDTHEFLAMTRLAGIPMSHPDALLHPERMVSLLARALRELHALPLRDCPFQATLNVVLPLARERVAAGLVDEGDFDDERKGQSAVSVFNELARTRPAHEDLVVTHGDPCLPNLIVNGEYVEGLIDVGRLGMADRHADLALAYRSTKYNLNGDYGEEFLNAYGRELVDMEKIAYYMMLDELF